MELKIRDLRQKDQFKIDDKYLNGYARVLGVYATAVYSSLSRHAEFHSQKCFPSEKLIAQEHNISERVVRNAIKKLKTAKIIQVEKERQKNGTWLNNLYYLADKSEWKKPEALNDLWLKKEARGTRRPQPEAPDDTARGTKGQYKDNKVIKDTKKKDTNIVGKADEEFNLLDEIKKILKDKQKHIQIIGIWLKAKAPDIENKKQLQSFIKRNLRAAKLLEGYPNKRIIEVIKWLKDNVDFKITLETVGKFVDEDLQKLTDKDKPLIIK